MRSSLLFLLPILLFAGEIEDEILAYKSRLETEVEKDRIWDCQWGLGKGRKLDQWHEALYWYLEAYQTNSVCLDPLLKIATYYRTHDENDLAYIFRQTCLPLSHRLPLRRGALDRLLLHPLQRRWLPGGQRPFDGKNVPWHVKYQTYRNLLFYIPNLKNTRYQPIEIELPYVVEGSDERLLSHEPSIERTEQGYKVICRAVNHAERGPRLFYQRS